MGLRHVEVFHAVYAHGSISTAPPYCRRSASLSRPPPWPVFAPGAATHGFDDPGKKRQDVAANAAATEDVRKRAGDRFEAQLASR